MIVFKYFLRILWTYKISIFLYFGIFGLISIMNMKQGSPTEYREIKAEIAVLDEDGSELSRHLTAYLTANNKILPAPERKDIDEQIFMGMFDLIVIIPKGFGENPMLEKLELNKNVLSTRSHKVIQEVSGYMLLWQISRQPDGSVDYALLDQALAQKAEIELLGKAGNTFGKEEWMKRYMNASAYPIIALIIFSIGMGMADFNNRRIAFRNKCSGYTLRYFQGQMFLSQLLFGVILWTWIILLGFILSGGLISGQYSLNLAVFITTVLSFCFFLNNVVKNKQVLSAIANIVALGSSFICGVFIPLEYLGSLVLKIARFLPAYYFVLVNEAIFNESGDWQLNMAMQLLFALVFLLLGFYVAKTRQREKALEI